VQRADDVIDHLGDEAHDRGGDVDDAVSNRLRNFGDVPCGERLPNSVCGGLRRGDDVADVDEQLGRK
jgi:hypothetical protein